MFDATANDTLLPPFVVVKFKGGISPGVYPTWMEGGIEGYKYGVSSSG